MSPADEHRNILYICGPYRASTVHGMKRNIRLAEKAMEWAWVHGWTPLCPHTNSAFIDGLVPDRVILAGYCKLLLRCDAVLLLRGYEESEGAVAELSLAEERNITILPWVYHEEM